MTAYIPRFAKPYQNASASRRREYDAFMAPATHRVRESELRMDLESDSFDLIESDTPAIAPKVAPKVAPRKMRPEDEFRAENPGMLEFLEGAASWSSFAADMVAKARRNSMTENQLGACQRMRAKCEARAEAKAAPKATVAVDLTPIRTMFDSAFTKGFKKPTYRAEGLVISLASMQGANPGALYIKDTNGGYLGKLVGTEFKPVRGGEIAGDALRTIAADPLGAAIAYGRKTGTCSCCGRTLTNAESIELGIGPICRDKYFGG